MEQVLCIDLSVEPARVALVSIAERVVNIIESRQFSLRNAVDFSELLEITLHEEHRNGNGAGEGGADKDDTVEGAEEKSRVAQPLEALVSALTDIPKTWTNSVVVIPMAEYLSLNLTLPFGDQKNIAKILDLEVQDVVPFEVDEFLVEGHALSEIGPNQFDVHVSLAPKRFIGNILTLCRASGIEPSIITTPCSSLATLAYLAPDYFKDSYALISVSPSGIYICASIDGVVRADKVISPLPQSAEDGQWFFSDLKLSLMALEKRYATTFTNVYVHASKKTVADLQQTLGRTVEQLELGDFVGENHKESALTALCALFAGETPVTPVTNFRVREYSFRPNWGALVRALGSIKYYFLGFAALILAATFIVYQVRELRISQLEAALREQIRAVVPGLKAGEGQEVSAFQVELLALSKELESLGSSNEISPMNILVDLSKDLIDKSDVTINQIDIRPDRVLLDVSVPDYAAADRIDRLLSRKKEIYRRVRKDASSYTSANGGRNFNFELKLVD